MLEPLPQSDVLRSVVSIAAALDAEHLRKLRQLIDEKLARLDGAAGTTATPPTGEPAGQNSSG